MNIGDINYLFALLTIVGQVGILALLADFLFADGKYITKHIRRDAQWIAFAIALLATLMSLYYSEVVGYVPCGLCWFQRIFLYPLVIIFGIALYKRDNVADYGLVLSLIGGAIGLYHHFIQMGGSHFIECPTSGGDCGARYIFEFGYVTFPLMAVVTFAMIAVLCLISRSSKKG